MSIFIDSNLTGISDRIARRASLSEFQESFFFNGAVHITIEFSQPPSPQQESTYRDAGLKAGSVCGEYCFYSIARQDIPAAVQVLRTQGSTVARVELTPISRAI